MRNIGINLKNYIRKNIFLFAIVSASLAIGLIIGSIYYMVLSKEEASYFLDYMGGFFSSINQESLRLDEIFWQTLFDNVKIVLMMWLFGFSLIGIPLELFIVGTRGFVFGFAVSSFVGMYGMKGFLIAICSFLPQLIIYIPALVGMAVLGMEFSLIFSKSDKKGVKPRLINYCIATLIYISVFMLSSVLESYVSGTLIKLASNLVV